MILIRLLHLVPSKRHSERMDIKRLVILTPGFPKDETDTTCIPFLQDFILELNDQYPSLKIDILAFDYPFN